MTVPTHTGLDGFVARYAGLRDRLPGDLSARDAAAEALRRAGLPTRRDEAWKYTDLRPVAAASFQEPMTQLAGDSALLARLPRLSAPRLVFVDGRYRPELSAPPVSIRFTPFADHAAFGALAQPRRDPLVALNTMLAEDGALLHVPEGMDAGALLLASIATDTGASTAFHPRHRITLEPGAKLTILEVSVGDGAYLHNPVTEVDVADGATLTHIRLQDEAAAAFHLSTLYAQVAAGGTYDSFALNLGGRMTRLEIHAHLTGSGGATNLSGVQLLSGRQHADVTCVVRHDAPRCASRQAVRNVLDGRARAVFQGRIEVARAAQKTDGFQMSRSLLLSPDAEVDTKPELEIFADDVKCSHGATVGALDAEQLFYLRSRGIPDAEARSMLIRAFLAEALEAVAQDEIRAVLEDSVQRWWERQQ